MNTYEAISFLRKNKNISISETIGNSLSKSSYYRYVNGKSDLYSENLLGILGNLHVSLEEVFLYVMGILILKKRNFSNE